MRSIAFLVVGAGMFASASANAGRSDPAFLGISFGLTPVGCTIDGITTGGPASEVGLRQADILTSIDSVAITTAHGCQDVNEAITNHAPGDRIRIEVLRDSEPIVVHVTLATRSEVLQHRVGQRMETTDLIGVDGTHHDLGERKGRTLVVGLFDPDCAGCGHEVDQIADRVADRIGRHAGAAIEVLAVTTGPSDDAGRAKLRALTSTVPLAIADSATYNDLALSDKDRVFFMVIDCRGIVRLVAPIAPDADDIDASADEVIAAAEQAEHARVRH